MHNILGCTVSHEIKPTRVVWCRREKKSLLCFFSKHQVINAREINANINQIQLYQTHPLTRGVTVTKWSAKKWKGNTTRILRIVVFSTTRKIRKCLTCKTSFSPPLCWLSICILAHGLKSKTQHSVSSRIQLTFGLAVACTKRIQKSIEEGKRILGLDIFYLFLIKEGGPRRGAAPWSLPPWLLCPTRRCFRSCPPRASCPGMTRGVFR